MFIGSKTAEYGAAFFCAAISMLPMLILYIFGQRYFVAGQASAGIKG
jgi:multiple sugar transport system permease protein